MKRLLAPFLILMLGLSNGCAYLTSEKKDVPPPLPPIEETKPPLKMKSEYFKAFPWGEVSKPRKDGNDPDTWMHTAKEGETLENIAENMMGSPGMADKLADYNELSSPTNVTVGEKVVIPYPIIGMNAQLMVKGAKEKDFGPPQPFNTEFKKGDEYKFRFEPNVDGYCYIVREGAKGITFLFPTPSKAPSQAPGKKGKRIKATEPLPSMPMKVRAFDPIEIPIGKKGFAYDPKKTADRVYVFLSLRKIPELEDLRDKTKTRDIKEIEDVMHRVKEGSIFTEGTIRLLRISDPAEILGFSLTING
ncbi:MAG: LysM peptidoglycan-binding domain-containing protein [Desulfomonile tiedjei]|nr:LysM peptidoglycan-binding domain-containing protein [Desulfomonile tiedjei]